MSIQLSWTGPNSFGVTSLTVDSNGTVVGGVGHEIGTGTTAPGIGIFAGTQALTFSGSVSNANFAFNPDFVPKSVVKAATQLYLYTFVDGAGYAPGGGGSTGWNIFPFRQQYESKKSTVEEDDYDSYVDLAGKRSGDYLASSTVARAARLPFVYPTAFQGVLTNRSSLEYTGVDMNNFVSQTVTGSFFSIPNAQELSSLTVDLNAAIVSSSQALGIQVNQVSPGRQWHDTTREENHPNGAGNYYPYIKLMDALGVDGVTYDIKIYGQRIGQLIPNAVNTVQDAQNGLGYYFGSGIGSTDDTTGNSNVWPAQTFQNRRDPAYLGISQYFGPITRTDLTYGDLISFLETGNNGGPFLPDRIPTGLVQGYQGSFPNITPFNYTYSTFLPAGSSTNVADVCPYVEITAKSVPPTGSIAFTKGTYTHVEVPKMYALGNEYTPSAIICHNAKRVYFFYYAYQDNKQCIAYNVLDECEEDDKRTYLPQFTTPPPPIPPTSAPVSPLAGYAPSAPVLNNPLPLTGFDRFGNPLQPGN